VTSCLQGTASSDRFGSDHTRYFWSSRDQSKMCHSTNKDKIKPLARLRSVTADATIWLISDDIYLQLFNFLISFNQAQCASRITAKLSINQSRAPRSASFVRVVSRRRTSAQGPRHPSLKRGVASDRGSSSVFIGRPSKGLPAISPSESASRLAQLRISSGDDLDDEGGAPLLVEPEETVDNSNKSTPADLRRPPAEKIGQVVDLDAKTSSEDNSNVPSSVASSSVMEDSNTGVGSDEGVDLKQLLSENREALKIRGIHRRGIASAVRNDALSKRSRFRERKEVRCARKSRRCQPEL
jgi:hypothetical protein